MEQVLARFNRLLRERAPGLHSGLKRQLQEWMGQADPAWSIPRRIGGRTVWTHPRLLSRDVAITQPFLLDWMKAQVKSGDVVFDVGAHYGWISLAAAQLVGQEGKVIAFEPSAALAEVLRFHVRRNGCPPVTVVEKAVAEGKEPAAEFYLIGGGLSYGNSLMIGGDVPVSPGAKKQRVTVESISLDAFCGETGWIPKLIKMDIEGAELRALRGAAGLLEKHRPVLVVEVHPYLLGEPQERLFELLGQWGYGIRERFVFNERGLEVGNYLLTSG